MVFLLDQENVAQHGLVGIKTLNEKDSIITFAGDNNHIPYKVEDMLNDTDSVVEIQNISVGTKNAADYQLVTCLTHLVVNNKDTKFVVLSRDKGFETSVCYLKENHPEIEIYRCSSILEYQMRDFFKKDLNLSTIKSKQLFELLWSLRYSKNTFIELKIKEQFPEIYPYFKNCLNDVLQYVREVKLKDTNNDDFVSEFSRYINESKRPEDTYSSLAILLGISVNNNEKYLKSIRRCIFRSEGFNDFQHRIMSNNEFLEIGEVKRIDIPKKVKPYYNVYKKSISKRG